MSEEGERGRIWTSLPREKNRKRRGICTCLPGEPERENKEKLGQTYQEEQREKGGEPKTNLGGGAGRQNKRKD